MELPQIINTYINTFNRHDLDAWLATFAPDGTYHDPTTTQPLSGQALKSHFAGVLTRFPDVKLETLALHAITADLVVWRWVMRGTNTGSAPGFPATGLRLNLPGCEFIAVRRGLVQRVEGYFDRLSLREQLGLVPGPPAGIAS